MVEPISLTLAIISTVAALIIGVIQILKGGWDCSGSECLSSDCCSKEIDIHDNEIHNIQAK
jgi:hypothetical protein